MRCWLCAPPLSRPSYLSWKRVEQRESAIAYRVAPQVAVRERTQAGGLPGMVGRAALLQAVSTTNVHRAPPVGRVGRKRRVLSLLREPTLHAGGAGAGPRAGRRGVRGPMSSARIESPQRAAAAWRRPVLAGNDFKRGQPGEREGGGGLPAVRLMAEPPFSLSPVVFQCRWRVFIRSVESYGSWRAV